uniref:non-specific serine/threonine protein kinase n=1 Tax=Trepomonas sp. PC1 TaxID=1076344 RepID=A0A146K2Z6_9EUKA|eukprot:JAP91077.1 Kinase, NEK [Trepomonas sp. PC1]
MEDISNYEEIKILGRGSFGTVSLVKFKPDEKQYALKVIPIGRLDADTQKYMFQEAEILKKLDHPNIVRYYTSFVRGHMMYIVMEYANYKSLFEYINKRIVTNKPFNKEEIANIAYQMLESLQYLHSQHILHRDLKPENIFLHRENGQIRVKIGDFGLAKILSTLAKGQSAVGSQFYMPPEIFKRKSYAYECDVWSFGCVFYIMNALKLPFYDANQQVYIDDIQKINYKPLPDKAAQEVISAVFQYQERRVKISDIMKMEFFTQSKQQIQADQYQDVANNPHENLAIPSIKGLQENFAEVAEVKRMDPPVAVKQKEPVQQKGGCC